MSGRGAAPSADFPIILRTSYHLITFSVGICCIHSRPAVFDIKKNSGDINFVAGVSHISKWTKNYTREINECDPAMHAPVSEVSCFELTTLTQDHEQNL